MPKGPRGEQGPTDVIGAAVKIMWITTGEEQDAPPPDNGKDAGAVSMGCKPAQAWDPEERRLLNTVWCCSGDRRKIGGHAAIAAGGCGALATWKRCPKPEPSVPL